MEIKCSKKGCRPEETGCIAGTRKYHNCDYFKEENKQVQEEGEAKKAVPKQEGHRLTWTSNGFGMDNLTFVSACSNVILLGLVGAPNAGKTTFLTLLYHMLISGEKIGDWEFSHSYTLQGWRNIASNMEWSSGNNYTFPAHTSKNAGRVEGFLHLAFNINGKIRDLIFTDVSGEWFTAWAIDKNKPDAEGAKWIHDHAAAFLFFLDCEKLKDRGTLAEGRQEIYSIADQLKDNVNGRSTAILWAKSDYKEAISERTVARITKKVERLIEDNYRFFEISYKPKSEKEDYYRENVFKTVLWLFEQLQAQKPTPILLEADVTKIDDPFFYFKR